MPTHAVPPAGIPLRRLLKKCRRISNAYPPHEAGFAGAPDAARLHPGLLRSSLACVLHEYACSGARRTGRIRTTWPPDLSAPLINSPLAGLGRARKATPLVVSQPGILASAGFAEHVVEQPAEKRFGEVRQPVGQEDDVPPRPARRAHDRSRNPRG